MTLFRSLLICSILSFFTASAQVDLGATKQPPPEWARQIELPETSESLKTNGIQFLLYNRQLDLDNSAGYYHFALKLETSEGVQEYSDTVDYDPAYQQLAFNKLIIHRNGESLDKLADHVINEYQREASLERSIYDGSKTAVINLSDVRQGDIIEYSYTLTGDHPAFPDHHFAHQRLQFATPMARIYFSVLASSSLNMRHELYEQAPVPEIDTYKGKKRYTWDLRDVPALDHYNNLPYWYNPVQRVVFTNYNSWGEVVKQVSPFFEHSAQEKAFFNEKLKEIAGGAEGEEQLLKLVRFVQDDLRYLGFESGLNAYKPHPSMQVFEQRFGDCKDKSHLLVGLLRAAGQEAYPVLVNTYERSGLQSSEISPFNFDHCTVRLKLKGEWVYIDPTVSNQGGKLENYNYPSYGKGLVLKRGVDELMEIPNKNNGRVEIHDELEVAPSNAIPSRFRVFTDYHGTEADNIRGYLLNSSRTDITKEFTDFYKAMYPHISSYSEIFVDDNREENVISTTEYYTVDSIWKMNDQEDLEARFGSMQMEYKINVERDLKRTAPYYLHLPVELKHKVLIRLPQEWPIVPEETGIDRDEYKFSYAVSTDERSKTLALSYNYKTLANHIMPEDIGRFVSDHIKMSEKVGYRITQYGGQTMASMGNTGVLGLVLFIMAAAAVGAFILLRKIHYRFDPAPAFWAKRGRRIGGLMILPAIGLVASPFVILFQMFVVEDVLDTAVLAGMLTPDSGSFNVGLALAYIIELVVQVLFLGYAIFCIIHFSSKRTTVPVLMCVFYGFNLLWPLLDSCMIFLMCGEWMQVQTTQGWVRAGIGAAIWAPFFLVSDRVKATFNRTLKDDEATEAVIAPPAGGALNT